MYSSVDSEGYRRDTGICMKKRLGAESNAQLMELVEKRIQDSFMV